VDLLVQFGYVRTYIDCFFQTFFYTEKEMTEAKTADLTCYLCSQAQQLHCKQCDQMYCNQCDTFIHRQKLASHVRHVRHVRHVQTQDNCACGKPVAAKCFNCKTSICNTCYKQKHFTHFVDMLEIKKEVKTEVKDIKDVKVKTTTLSLTSLKAVSQDTSSQTTNNPVISVEQKNSNVIVWWDYENMHPKAKLEDLTQVVKDIETLAKQYGNNVEINVYVCMSDHHGQAINLLSCLSDSFKDYRDGLKISLKLTLLACSEQASDKEIIYQMHPCLRQKGDTCILISSDAGFARYVAALYQEKHKVILICSKKRTRKSYFTNPFFQDVVRWEGVTKIPISQKLLDNEKLKRLSSVALETASSELALATAPESPELRSSEERSCPWQSDNKSLDDLVEW